MKRVYLAGPISGTTDYVERFAEAKRQIENLGNGLEVVNPVEDAPLNASYREYINLGLAKLMTCDFICMLRGYEDSKGARAELAYARAVDMPVISMTGPIRDEYKLGEWIPVSETLPEESGRYLVFTRWDGIECVFFHDLTSDWLQYDIDEIHSDEVLAWMPLPKPYKGGE